MVKEGSGVSHRVHSNRLLGMLCVCRHADPRAHVLWGLNEDAVEFKDSSKVMLAWFCVSARLVRLRVCPHSILYTASIQAQCEAYRLDHARPLGTANTRHGNHAGREEP